MDLIIVKKRSSKLVKVIIRKAPKHECTILIGSPVRQFLVLFCFLFVCLFGFFLRWNRVNLRLTYSIVWWFNRFDRIYLFSDRMLNLPGSCPSWAMMIRLCHRLFLLLWVTFVTFEILSTPLRYRGH